MTALSDDEIHTIAAQTLGEHAANQLTGINRFARALLAAQPAVQQPAEDAGLLDRHGKIRGDLKASAYCVGNEYKPFHPSASHVRPEWRDGWNACYVAAIRAAAAVDVQGLMDAADRYALAQADPAHWRAALESALRLALVAREDKPDALSGCQCQTCRPFSPMDPKSIRMILCAICGNKRCPHATDHRNACTNSNEPGQPGSSYAAAPKGTP